MNDVTIKRVYRILVFNPQIKGCADMFRRAHDISKPEDFKSLTAKDFEGAGRCLVALTDDEMDAIPKAAQETVLLQLSDAICRMNLPRKVRRKLAQRVIKMVKPRRLVLCLSVTRMSSICISAIFHGCHWFCLGLWFV